MHANNTFNLQQFLAAVMQIPRGEKAVDVSEYEQLLIEILGAIPDDLIVRETAIKLLESPPIKRIDWMIKEYNGKNYAFKFIS